MNEATLPTAAVSKTVTPRTRPALLSLFQRVAPAILFCLVLVAGWELMARTLQSPLVPNVALIGGEILGLLDGSQAFQQIGITLLRILSGFGAAFVVSIFIGIACARYRPVRTFFEPAIILGLTVPGLVWALLCVIWFGVSMATPTTAIALGIAPALVLSVIQGVQSVDAEVIEMAHVYKIPARLRLTRIWLPSLVPSLLSGGRIAFSIAWKVVVLVEIFGLSDGVGYQLNSAFSMQNVEAVLAWTVVFWLCMVVIEYGIFQVLDKRLNRWRRRARV